LDEQPNRLVVVVAMVVVELRVVVVVVDVAVVVAVVDLVVVVKLVDEVVVSKLLSEVFVGISVVEVVVRVNVVTVVVVVVEVEGTNSGGKNPAEQRQPSIGRNPSLPKGHATAVHVEL
jgi:hypothetical protein